MSPVSPRFQKGFNAVKLLEQHPRYLAAFVFGSVAEGTANHKSDLDVKVIVYEDNSCSNINHPVIDGYKLDITFISFKQLKAFVDDEIRKGDREPNLVRGIIIFDKTGELTKLQQQVAKTKAFKYKRSDYQFVQFMLYHANNKVERFIEDDPLAALYSMHANIGEVLKNYYKLKGRWWVSSKKVLADLEQWDKELADLVKQFISTADVQQKCAHWAAIIDHVTEPMGGRQPISENNCDCAVCRVDLQRLQLNVNQAV